MSAATARASIEALIAQGAANTSETTEVSVHIEGDEAAGYLAELEFERGDEEGERTLRGARCDDVTGAATLVIAMVIDPSAAERVPEPKPPAPAPELKAEPERDPNEATTPLRFSLGIALLGDLGSLPYATLGAGLSLGVHVSRVRFELGALALLPQHADVGPTAASSTLVSLYGGELRACFAAIESLSGVLALEGCASAELGASSAESQGISNGTRSSALWSAGFLGLGARQASEAGLQLGALAEIGAPILRPVYEIDGFGPVFRATPVLARLSLSARWLFP